MFCWSMYVSRRRSVACSSSVEVRFTVEGVDNGRATTRVHTQARGEGADARCRSGVQRFMPLNPGFYEVVT